MKRFLIAVAVLLALAGERAVLANGQLVLLQADPKPDAVLHKTPQVVRLVFNLELQPGSLARVEDARGRRVDRGAGGLDPMDKRRRTLLVHLRPLRSGRYTVLWRAVVHEAGEDHEHVFHGSYRFAIR